VFFALVVKLSHQHSSEHPDEAKSYLEEEDDPSGLWDVVNDVANDYQAKHECHLHVNLHLGKRRVVNGHAALDYTDAVEFGHGDTKRAYLPA